MEKNVYNINTVTCILYDSTGPGKLVRHVQSLSYTYDTYLICMGLGPSISSIIAKSLTYSGPSYASLPVVSSSLTTFSCLYPIKHHCELFIINTFMTN